MFSPFSSKHIGKVTYSDWRFFFLMSVVHEMIGYEGGYDLPAICDPFVFFPYYVHNIRISVTPVKDINCT
jgi:hypothetical protein